MKPSVTIISTQSLLPINIAAKHKIMCFEYPNLVTIIKMFECFSRAIELQIVHEPV